MYYVISEIQKGSLFKFLDLSILFYSINEENTTNACAYSSALFPNNFGTLSQMYSTLVCTKNRIHWMASNSSYRIPCGAWDASAMRVLSEIVIYWLVDILISFMYLLFLNGLHVLYALLNERSNFFESTWDNKNWHVFV